MSDFTIEQLEALKEGTTPGPWEAKEDHGGPNLFSPAGRLMSSDSCGDVSGEGNDVMLMAAAPALIDALIAEKRAHQKLRAEVEALLESYTISRDSEHRKDKFSTVPLTVVYDRIHNRLTRILEGE